MERFDSFLRPLGGVERAEELQRTPPPTDESVFLLNYVIKVFNTTELEIEGQDFLVL